MIRLFLVFQIVFAFLVMPQQSDAHALQPGYLEVVPLGPGTWSITWRKPQVSGQAMAIDALLPESCADRRGPPPQFDGRAFVTRWVTACDNGIAGGVIEIDGLDQTRTDVLVRYVVTPGGPAQSHRLTPQDITFEIPRDKGWLARFADYFRLGVDHILSGLDHLLFVFALLLLIRKPGPLVAAITSFTIAHSVSLGAATFGWVVVPAPVVEAIIALSIVVLATELAQPAHKGLRLTERWPWTVAFLFGLLHGLGFASALVELGLPRADIPLALLGFNLGVEAGQLLFVAAILSAGFVLSRLLQTGSKSLLPKGSIGLRITAYAIGTLSAVWMFDRVADFMA